MHLMWVYAATAGRNCTEEIPKTIELHDDDAALTTETTSVSYMASYTNSVSEHEFRLNLRQQFHFSYFSWQHAKIFAVYRYQENTSTMFGID